MRTKIATRLENAFSLIELLAVMFIVALADATYQIVHLKYGPGLAGVASVVAGLVGVFLIILFYRWMHRRGKRRLTELREKYRTIYRVKELPTDLKSIVKPEWAETQIGDYGWDARPVRRDGLIHLQGLTKRWQVVWHAGFRPEQIEKVAEKPASQYDYWVPLWAKPPPPPPCPFPVQERNTPTMGLPYHSSGYSKEWPSQYYPSPLKAESSPNEPVMTAAEWAARNKPLNRLSLIKFLLFIAILFGTSRLCFYMDRANPALWIQVLTFCGILGAFAIYFLLSRRMTKQIVKKNGFQCPVCGNEITASVGLAGWPNGELCNRCGTKVIEFNEPNPVSKTK